MSDPAANLPRHADVRCEGSDASAGGVVLFGVALFLLVIGVLAISAWMIAGFSEFARRGDTPVSPERATLPADLNKIRPPVLQQSEPADLARLRHLENKRLAEYGWVDAKAGVVHIPITEAMRLLADPKFARAHGIRVDDRKKGGRP